MPDNRITFRCPPAVLAAYEAAAAKAGVPLGRWVQDAATAALPASVRKQLPEPRAAHRPKSTGTEGER